MSNVEAKMHLNRFRLRMRPRPRWGSLQRSPGTLAEIKGTLLLREWGAKTKRGGEGMGRGVEGGKGSGSEGKTEKESRVYPCVYL